MPRRRTLQAWSERVAAGRFGPCATWAMPPCRIRATSTALRPGRARNSFLFKQFRPITKLFMSLCGEVIFRSCCHPTTCRLGLCSGKCLVDACQCQTISWLCKVCRFAALLSLGLWTVAMPWSTGRSLLFQQLLSRACGGRCECHCLEWGEGRWSFCYSDIAYLQDLINLNHHQSSFISAFWVSCVDKHTIVQDVLISFWYAYGFYHISLIFSDIVLNHGL